jgi:hypothetical protein
MVTILTLRAYSRLLENEWRERIYARLIRNVAESYQVSPELLTRIDNFYFTWERKRPFARGQDAGSDDYTAYRRRQFDLQFGALQMSLPVRAQEALAVEISAAEIEDLPRFQRQMSILARLEPSSNGETAIPYSLEDAVIAVVYNRQYYLFPVYNKGQQALMDIHRLRRMTSDMLHYPVPVSTPAEIDLLLSRANRTALSSPFSAWDEVKPVLSALQYTPIILNWDKQDARLPLAVIRQTHRGIGSHALTLLFTDESTLFDQSHIFFDGAWGASLAEIMTNEALSWALYVSQLPAPNPSATPPPIVPMKASLKLREATEKARISLEVDAETTAIRLGPVLALRRLFKSRNDLLNVTVNDLLILWRSLFGQRYNPSSILNQQLEALRNGTRSDHRQAYQLCLEAIEKIKSNNPAILIPMDASQYSPRDRLFPTTFRNPMADLLTLHDATLSALNAYKIALGDRASAYEQFDDNQRQYLRRIGAFGELMRKYKEITLAGQSTSTTSIKMLAHIPEPMQRLLDQIPGKFDLLNEIIKGEEVFSNVGRVANGSTLRRFITAKDDNRQKTLAWGIVTDDNDVVHVSLRDFRPHAPVLIDMGLAHIAQLMTQDMLNAYADGFNQFIREMRDITIASRETRSRNAHEEG